MILTPCWSDFDEYTIDTYTSGDCYLLALELHLMGAGELAVVAVEDNPDEWTHMFIKVGDGLYLDIEGVQPGEDLLENWGWRIKSARLTPQIIPITLNDYSRIIRGQSNSIYSVSDHQKIARKLLASISSLK